MKKWILSLLGLLFAVLGWSNIRLPKLISNGMVLQRQVPLRIWGWADAGEAITVRFNGKVFNTVADTQGNWQVNIPPQLAAQSLQMQLAGKNTITIDDIAIGEVWLCSGQSNMELEMLRLKYKYASLISTTRLPLVRQFTVPDRYNFKQPQKDFDNGKWVAATSVENIYSFSGVAFFFGKELFEQYKVPIGLINAALGGSPAEAWISEEGLKPFPAYLSEAIRFRSDSLIKAIESNDQLVSQQWYAQLNKLDAGLQEQWKLTATRLEGWQPFQVPGYWADKLGKNVNGVFWFRKKIQVPASMIGVPVKLELGRIVDADSVFINGRFVGNVTYQYPPRRYELPSGILVAGENEIVVRLENNSGKGGFVLDKRYEITTASDTIDLKGAWLYKNGAVMDPLPGSTFIRWKPMGLYNAMIAPLHQYAIKGAIWFQGESNAGRPGDYLPLMQALIGDWRSKWSLGNFPFLFVQLANFMEAKQQPVESSWAQLREQQRQTLQVPKTGMAVAIDAGDWNDIHPEDKQTIGHRLALQARKLVYGEKKLVASGPMYASMAKKGNRVVLLFTQTGTGLKSGDGKALQQFSIAGAEGKFVWANARIIAHNKVEVWSDQVSEPVTVRYAWADNPQGSNLYNREGLPASPFTTKEE